MNQNRQRQEGSKSCPKSISTKTDKSNSKKILSYSISTKYMNGIISAIPNNWKHIIMCETKIHDLICNFTNYIFREFEKSLVCAIKMRKWFRNFCRRSAWHLFKVLWITKDTKLHNFQLKLLPIILPCNLVQHVKL